MGLKLTLKPNERIVVNGCVIRNSNKRQVITIENRADVVRGEDLADSTARQVLLQRMLGLATPRYLHVPLVRDEAGEKLSKQTGAAAFVPGPAALAQAMRDLGLGSSGAATVPGLLADAVDRWRASWGEG